MENEHLQALIDRLTDGVEVGDWFAELTDSHLSDMDAAAVAAFDAIRSQDGGVTAEDADRLETIANAADAVRAEVGRREQANAELQERVETLTQRLGQPKGDAADAAADAPADTNRGDGDGGASEQVGDTADAGQDLATATASAVAPARRARVNLSDLRARQPVEARALPANQPTNQVSIIAASDVPGFAAGQELTSVADIAAALTSRFQQMPIGSPNVTHRAGVAVIRRNLPADLVASGRGDYDVVEHAADESRLPGGSLVAAVQQSAQSLTAATAPGIPQDQWCSPSQTDYTLCSPLETNGGMIDLPTVQITRGGIRYPQAIPWPALYDMVTTYAEGSTDPASGSGAQILPPDGITGPVDGPAIKHCVTIPCPKWEEERLHAAPFCVETEIPMETAWPELVQQFVQRALVARQHRINTYLIAQIAARSTPTTVTDGQWGTDPAWGASRTTLDMIAMQAEWYRDLNRMAENATLEVVAPMWLKAVLRQDMAKRVAVGADAVTDAMVAQHFAVLGVRIQWVRDWQTLGTRTGSGTDEDPYVWPPLAGWPDHVQLLMYPAGTWVRGTADIIRLDAIYDSTNLLHNRYMKTFFEDGILLLKRCYESLLLNVPICINGTSGGLVTSCAGQAVTPPPAAVKVPAGSPAKAGGQPAAGAPKK